MKNKAVFLDRDGTIARDVHYCSRVEDFNLLPTVPQAIRLLNENGYKVVVITNQSGIARGYFTEETLDQIHKKMEDELGKSGARVDAIYYCPHHPDDKCECRKPGTVLFHRAAGELDIDLERSFVIGDMQIDIDAGKALGCGTVAVTTGHEEGGGITGSPDYMAESLMEGVRWILEETNIKPEPSTSVIVPAYNEQEGLPVVLEKIFKVADDSYEVVVIDDGSEDRTSEVSLTFPVKLIRHEKNLGKGEALRTAIKNARGDNLIWIDADDTYPAELIPEMAQALCDYDYDIVVCSRKYGQQNIPRFNRIGNFIFRTMIKTVYRFKPYEPCSGLYGVKKRYLELMNLSSHRFAIEPEISIKGARMKLKMLDIPIEYKARIGKAKLNGIKVGFEDLWTILRLIPWCPRRGANG